MDDLVAQAGLHQFRRRDRSGRQQDVDIAAPQFPQQRNERERLAHACRMSPYERAPRARLAGMAQTLGAPPAVFLALEAPIGEVGACQRIEQDAGNPIAGQRCARQTPAHRACSRSLATCTNMEVPPLDHLS